MLARSHTAPAPAHAAHLGPCWIYSGAGRYAAIYEIEGGNTHRKVWHRGALEYAHRVSFRHYHGPIPEKKVVRHLCDRGACWSPFHLAPGSRRENYEDMVSRGRSKLRQHVTRTPPDCPF
jgi:hypothetical protein